MQHQPQRDQAADQAAQDQQVQGLVWHRGYLPPRNPPDDAVTSIWALGVMHWYDHGPGPHEHCEKCSSAAGRVAWPCPDVILAQHVMLQALLLGGGSTAQKMISALVTEARVWLPPLPGGGHAVTGINVATTYQHRAP
jgi:hypothetical protein